MDKVWMEWGMNRKVSLWNHAGPFTMSNGTLMGSVVVGLGDGSTLEAGGRPSGSTLGADAGSMGVGTLGDC